MYVCYVVQLIKAVENFKDIMIIHVPIDILIPSNCPKFVNSLFVREARYPKEKSRITFISRIITKDARVTNISFLHA